MRKKNLNILFLAITCYISSVSSAFCTDVTPYKLPENIDLKWLLEVDLDNDFFNRTKFDNPQIKRRALNIIEIATAKRNIIDGDFAAAEQILSDVKFNESELSTIVNRYRAIIAFHKQDWKKGLNLLDQNKINAIQFKKTCLMKSLFQIASNDNDLKYDMSFCSYLNQEENENSFLWSNHVLRIKELDFKYIDDKDIFNQYLRPGSNESIKLWLKASLLSGKEKNIIPYLTLLPSTAFQSNQIRELIGLIYQRLGIHELALDFIKDIDSLNAENIRGQIELINKKYELAYGHFKLALQKREFSRTAHDRILPLVWLLEKWEDGLELSNQNFAEGIDIEKKLALNIALHLQLDQMDEAAKILKFLDSKFTKQVPTLVEQMASYVALKKNNSQQLSTKSSSVCLRLDSINCWLFYKSSTERNFSNFVIEHSNDQIPTISEFDSRKKPTVIEPIDEIIYVNQSDIENLDQKIVFNLTYR